MSQTNWPLLLLVVSLVFGGFAFFCLVQVVRLLRIRAGGVYADGEVVEILRATQSDGTTQDVPVIRYRVREREYDIVPRVMASPSMYRKGQIVPVFYPLGQPEKAFIVATAEFVKWILLCAACLGAIALAVIGWVTS